MTDLSQEIETLKRELEEKKKEIRSLEKLVRGAIDRDFPLEVAEFSERELEDYFRDAVPPLKQVLDPRPGPKSVRSHRKVIGAPIVFLKRLFLRIFGFYTHLLLDEQAKFNRRSAELTEALVTRLRHYRERLEQAEDKVAAFEESLVILKNKIEELRSRTAAPPGGRDTPPTR
ncbi:MAG: hypothetical protein A2W03_09650 [Candidatus Aminicenantes bacterium RBG_16_63_16]|nr:MAG: hypothetical protein A2W03_09650 [Candidatus Aminicenantes bacterium RBG_16_63_16]